MASWRARARTGSWAVCVSFGSTVGRKGRSTSNWGRRSDVRSSIERCSRVEVYATSCERWGGREFATWEDDGNVDDGSINLRFVHVGNGSFSVGFGCIKDVGCSTIGVDCKLALENGSRMVTYKICSSACPNREFVHIDQISLGGGLR